MAAIFVLGLFSAALIACLLGGQSVLYALAFGYILFFCYGLCTRHRVREMLAFSLEGVRTVQNILVTFILIGAITAVWRLCGTIPIIVAYATQFCAPSVMLVVTFWLCCIMSALTGTSFGTAATVGVICTTMATSMGLPLILVGGAVLSGAFFGDRCSPMSTSALLVAELTKTDIYKNIILMVKTSWMPFCLSSAAYFLLGLFCSAKAATAQVQSLFAQNFSLNPLAWVPALLVIVLCALRANVKIAMSASIAAAVLCAAWVEGASASTIVQTIVQGYRPENAALAALLSGGGVLSMTNVFAIVCVSASYAGIFKGTGFLQELQAYVHTLAQKITPFGAFLATSAITSMISCNQTLAIMLTHQLCAPLERSQEETAVHLENTAVIIAPLVPWSIAGAVPLASIGAPVVCVVTAFYLWLVPLCNLIYALATRKKTKCSILPENSVT